MTLQTPEKDAGSLQGLLFGMLHVESQHKSGRYGAACQCGEMVSATAEELLSGMRKSCGDPECAAMAAGETVEAGSREEEGFKPLPTKVKRVVYADLAAELGVPEKDVRRMVARLQSARGRCENPRDRNYPWVGDIGVKFHKPWSDDPSAFVRWSVLYGNYRPEHYFGRKDNELDFDPSNCLWTTKRELSHSRTSSYRWWVGSREYPSMTALAEEVGISPFAVRYRAESPHWPQWRREPRGAQRRSDQSQVE